MVLCPNRPGCHWSIYLVSKNFTTLIYFISQSAGNASNIHLFKNAVRPCSEFNHQCNLIPLMKFLSPFRPDPGQLTKRVLVFVFGTKRWFHQAVFLAQIDLIFLHISAVKCEDSRLKAGPAQVTLYITCPEYLLPDLDQESSEDMIGMYIESYELIYLFERSLYI